MVLSLEGAFTKSTEVPSTPESKSPCEIQCQIQRVALADCVDVLRRARERQQTDDNDESAASPSESASSCLRPAVEAWTQCCADANREAGFDVESDGADD